MIFKEKVAVYPSDHTRQVNTMYRQTAVYFFVLQQERVICENCYLNGVRQVAILGRANRYMLSLCKL